MQHPADPIPLCRLFVSLLLLLLSVITDAVQAQLLNPAGCPIYCIDLRGQSWLEDGCICNLDRIKVGWVGGWVGGGR